MCMVLGFCTFVAFFVSQIEPAVDNAKPFVNRQVLEFLEYRLHISKGGEWGLSLEVRFRLEGADPNQEEKLANELAEEAFELWSIAIPEKRREIERIDGHRWRGQITGAKSKDMTLLAYWLRHNLEMFDCTFSWNKKAFELRGAGLSVKEQRMEGRIARRTEGGWSGSFADQFGKDLDRFVEAEAVKIAATEFFKANLTAIVDYFELDFLGVRSIAESISGSGRIVITTEGKISTIAPAKLSSDQKMLTIDVMRLGERKSDRFWIRIDDLESP